VFRELVAAGVRPAPPRITRKRDRAGAWKRPTFARRVPRRAARGVRQSDGGRSRQRLASLARTDSARYLAGTGSHNAFVM